jgi:hypothetical protein
MRMVSVCARFLPLLGLWAAAAWAEGPTAAASSGLEGPWDLSWRWQPGWVHEIETRTETRVTKSEKSTQQHLPSLLKVIQHTSMAVRASPGGQRLVEVRIESVRGEVQGEGHAEFFDSRRPAETPESLRPLLRAVGEGFVMRYDAAGTLLGIEGVEVPAAGPGQWADLLELASRKQSAELFERSLRWPLPGQAVKLGQSWPLQGELRFPSSGPVAVKAQAQLAEIEATGIRPQARIEFRGSLQSAGQGNVQRLMGLGEGSSIEGSLWWDLQRGMLVRSAQRANLKLRLRNETLPVIQKVELRLLGSSEDRVLASPVAAPAAGSDQPKAR